VWRNIHAEEIQGVKMEVKTGTWTEKKGLAQMLKGGVIMDVVTAEHARIAEEA
jgi:pyridoxal 5'-phosphate synthase pdxS subunit